MAPSNAKGFLLHRLDIHRLLRTRDGGSWLDAYLKNEGHTIGNSSVDPSFMIG
jgi:hypothetical protein